MEKCKVQEIDKISFMRTEMTFNEEEPDHSPGNDG